MLGLGLGTGPKCRTRNKLFPGARIQLDTALPGSALAGQWRDLAGSNHFTATNAALSNPGLSSAYYTLSGDGKFVATSNPTFIANAHKTIAGNKWTFVLTGKTTALDNDWMLGTFYASPQNGLAMRYNGNATLTLTQYTSGSSSAVSQFATLPNSATFILILSYDYDTNNLRCWINSASAAYDGNGSFAANTNAPDGLFTLGGYGNTPEFNGELYSFLALDEFCTPAKAAQIIAYYNAIHPRTYA